MLGHVDMALSFRGFFSLYQVSFCLVAQAFHTLYNPVSATFSPYRS
jgi:hypothetical protein